MLLTIVFCGIPEKRVAAFPDTLNAEAGSRVFAWQKWVSAFLTNLFTSQRLCCRRRAVISLIFLGSSHWHRSCMLATESWWRLGGRKTQWRDTGNPYWRSRAVSP